VRTISTGGPNSGEPLTGTANPTDSRTYNTLSAAHHYLGYTPLAGAQLRYLVDTPAGIVGLLGFAASAWKCAVECSRFY
jgi:hypothetical protein